MTTTLAVLGRDLVAEQDDLDRLVAPLDDAGWGRATPSPGWTVADQVAHLARFDAAAAQAIVDADGFLAVRPEIVAALEESEAALDRLVLTPYRAMAPEELLATWRASRAQLADAAAGLQDGDRLPWFGPSMGAASFLTARLMETWAHGQDVADALEVRRVSTDRLRHVAVLGVKTRGWSYRNRGLEPPAAEVRVELVSPGGDRWAFGPADADDRVTGTAEDFCLVVTRRRRVADTGLRVDGPAATEWMALAQAFAGPPSTGP